MGFIPNREKICRGLGKGVERKRGEMMKELDALTNEVIDFRLVYSAGTVDDGKNFMLEKVKVIKVI